jgi:branched-chain amino acid transport system ATP-binding protein
MLELSGIDVHYAKNQVLKRVALIVADREIVALIGANAAGKTTTLRTIMGLKAPSAGTISFDGAMLNGTTTSERVDRGLALIPEGRQVFPKFSVTENLLMGAYHRHDRNRLDRDLGMLFDMFPRLSERRRQAAGSMSGGEQQMLAIGRALMARPRLLLLDEPSLGLAPLIVKQIFDVIREINTEQKVTVFLVEQNAFHALKLAHRGYVMQTGRIIMSGTGRELLANKDVRAAYLEGGH